MRAAWSRSRSGGESRPETTSPTKFTFTAVRTDRILLVGARYDDAAEEQRLRERRLAQVGEFRYRRAAQQAGFLDDGEDLDARSVVYQRTLRALLDAQRSELVRQRDAGALPDETMHALIRELDLEDQPLEI
jgi:hypothetical protein